MTKEEIKDFLEVNSQEDTIDYIFKLESDLKRNINALDGAKVLLKDSVSRDRYNVLLKDYNELKDECKKLQEELNKK